MRLLFLASTLPRFPGDSQANFVREQADAWLAARPEHHITILAPHDTGALREERHGRLTIVRFRYMRPEGWQRLAYPAILPNLQRNPLLALQVPLFLLAQAQAAQRIIREDGVDAIYAHWVMPQGLVAYWLKRTTGTPYILQTHSSDLPIFAKAGAAGRRVALALLRGCRRFFCVNSSQLDIAESYHPPGERAEFASKVSVLPMGVADLGVARPESDGPDIGVMGRFSRKKGFDFLIEAAEQLARDGVRPRIVIAGDGEEAARLKALVHVANVEFPGFLVGAEKEAFLASCARFAFPSKATEGDVEGLPVALLEALMRGQPVLASRDTNVELLPEWPRISDDVVLVSDPSDLVVLADALRGLLQKPPGAATESAKILSRYRWERLIEEYLLPIEQSLTEPG